MGVPVGKVVTSVRVKWVVKDDQKVLIATMIAHVDTRVHLGCLQHGLQAHQSAT